MHRNLNIQIKSIFDPVEESDGWRIYVERRKPTRRRWEDLKINRQEIVHAPGSELLHLDLHDRTQWQRFREFYERQLEAATDLYGDILAGLPAGQTKITLLYETGNHKHNPALVIKEELLARHRHRVS